MIIGIIFLGILGFAFIYMADDNDTIGWFGVAMFFMAIAMFIFGCFNGFVDHPKTEGIHQGVITAVDLERGIF